MNAEAATVSNAAVPVPGGGPPGIPARAAAPGAASAPLPAPVVQRVAETLRPLFMLIGIAAAVAVGVAVTLWSQTPEYSVLYAGLSMEDTAAIVQALDAGGIPHRLEPGTGAITVPAARLADARLRLAGQGLPQTDASFAAMSKEQGFGVSQFMENARYQHALEGELARTISSLKSVQGARVHIAKPRDSAFVHDKHAASASVFLQLKTGRRLESEEVTAIVNLVASSVPELTPDQVTVIDNTGRLLSSPEGQGDFAARDKEFEYANRLEAGYKDRIEALLAPLVGAGRVRAQVVAQVDMSSSEEAHEQYNPDHEAVRSEQTSEETSRNGGNGGVPGALSNQPPAGGVVAPAASPLPTTAPAPGATAAKTAAGVAASSAAASSATPGPPDSTSKQSTRNYELDRTLGYTRQPAGKLKRLTVAVLIDNLRTADAKGKITETPLPADQLDRITALVKDAVGFDTTRGDSIEVLNAPFRGDLLEQPKDFDTVPIWERPFVRDLARILAGLITVALIVLAVLRPLLRNLVGPAKEVAFPTRTKSKSRTAAADGKAGKDREPGDGAADADGDAVRIQVDPAAAAHLYQEQLKAARALVSQDPKRVAQVVKTWVSADE
jgi:flagellar M-ring protein FliF